METEEQSPEFYRQRYAELKAKAQQAKANPAIAPMAAPTFDDAAVLFKETIPGGWYWTGRLARGHCLRIVNTSANDGVSAFFWNAQDTSERYSPADSIKVQWTARLGLGKLLLSDMGRVLASITGDSCGYHDSVVGGSTPESNARNFGGSHRNTRDNLILAAGKHGMAARDVGPCITFFAPVITDEGGAFLWKDGVLKPSDHVDLRAEMDLIVALSNCPHALSPAKTFAPKPVDMLIWRAPSVGDDDFCRNASEEAKRAFENTESYLAGNQ
jgi:urea carboxylase-associated protein 2